MDKSHRELLEEHRAMFRQSVEVEQLLPFLLAGEGLTTQDIAEINKHKSREGKVDALIDQLLKTKSVKTFQTLCTALENTYPHLLTLMFLGNKKYDSQPLTLDTEDDVTLSKITSMTSNDEGGGALRPYGRPVSIHGDQDLGANNVSIFKAELKLVSPDHKDTLREDPLRKNVPYKIDYQRDSYKVHPSHTMPITSSHQSPMSSTSSMGQHRDYEWLKNQFDSAMKELQSLTQQHSDTIQKCNQAMKEADSYRQQYQITKDKMEHRASEYHLMKAQYKEVLAEKQRHEHQINELQNLRREDKIEMDELRQQQREVISESGSSEVLNKMYDNANAKYEATKHDYDQLRKRYGEVLASGAASNTKLEVLDEENERLRKQIKDITSEKNNLIIERQGLQTQCRTAIMKWDEIEKELHRVRTDRDQFKKQCNQAMTDNLKVIGRIRGERDRAAHESRLIMSERDSVLKEIEQLQDKVEELTKKYEGSEKDKKNALDEVETLRREITSALQDRDHALKQINDLKERHSDMEFQSMDNDTDNRLGPDHNFNRRDRLSGTERDRSRLEEKTKRESMEISEEVSKEHEALKKEVERLKSELQDALQEAEVSKRRRDWAFSERDKIVLERESIRTLCDKLRRERDRAVSEQAEALRDLDDRKKQKNEIAKELKETKDRLDLIQEKESRKTQLNSVGQNNSHDSAIDADLQEWEIETLEFDIGGVTLDDVGFEIVGGKDDPQFPNDNSIYVCMVNKNSPAYGKLKVNDQIVKVNNTDVTNADRKTAAQAIRNCGGIINMVVRRRKTTIPRAVPVHFNLSGGKDLGISLETGFYVSRIYSGSVAAKEGNVAVGDRVLNINGHSLDSFSIQDVNRYVAKSGSHIVFSVLKYGITPQPSIVSNSSSGHNLTESSPDALSTSPKSPHSRLWANTSPDSNKISLKSSGSQTDSLDSPPTSARSPIRVGGQGRVFNKPFLNTLERDRERSEMSHSNSGVGLGMGRIKTSATVSPASSHDSPPPLPTHPPPPLPSPHRTMEEEVINDLNEIIVRYGKSIAPATLSGSKEKRTRAHKDDNAGTWPKCRGTLDYPGAPQAFPPAAVKTRERPSLAAITNDHSYGRPTSSPGAKVAPTPPERSDSFNRSKSINSSIKHSPQNSSEAQKYQAQSVSSPSSMHHHSKHLMTSEVSAGMTHHIAKHTPSSLSYLMTSTTKSSSYLSSPGSQQSAHGPLTSPQSLDKERSKPLMHSSLDSTKDNSPYYGLSSSSQTNSGLMTDNTVASANNPENIQTHVHKRRQNRPNSAPGSRSRKERKELAGHIHGSHSGHGRTVPTSLDIQPIYSPRPMPHSGRNITPSSQSNRSGAISPISTSQGYPMGSSGGHMMRSQGMVHQVIGLHAVSPGPTPPPILHSPRYTSPSSHQGNNSIPSIPEMDPGDHRMYRQHPLYGTPSPSPSQQSSTYEHSLPTSSEEFPTSFPYHSRPGRGAGRIDYLPSDPYSTFPSNKRHANRTERIRIPSNPSVISSGKISTTSSLEGVAFSDRGGSPISPFTPTGLEYASPAQSNNSLPAPIRPRVKLEKGETRRIKVEKSMEPLGIKIETARGGGIFVSSVSEKSLASQAGLQVGDQLLEVCGINMRGANYELAASVLRQCGNSITMLVQYNPDKYEEDLSDSGGSSPETSATNTPEPTPRGNHKPPYPVGSDVSTITPDSPQSMSPSHGPKSSQHENPYMPCEPRFVFLKKNNPHEDLGIVLKGGNAVGIFVHNIQMNSLAIGQQGLRCGDQILEFNGTNLRTATAEQAALIISEPAETVSILAQYNFNKYNKILDQPGDSLYMRAMFDRDQDQDGELSFKKDDILYVDNTMFNGKRGTWRAWLVDDEGSKLRCGTIPSKSRLEDELAQRRSLSDVMHDDELKGSRRGSASARRSFFRRKRHQRNNSKDSRELSSFSDQSINSDSTPFLDADGCLVTFTRVERLDCKVCRPVVLIGPLADPLISKLTSESPDKYCMCNPDIVRASISSLEQGQDSGIFVEFRHRDSHYDCITVSAVQDIIAKNRHCMLSVDPSSVERLHKVQIYPIVIFIRHKSAKQIREVKDTRFLPEKMSSKSAKEMFELYSKYDHDYKHLFSDVVHGDNLAVMCFKIKATIEKEQKKTLWIPSGTL